ncbi:winged helix-turn-helix domain-containing protein [Bullifex porci]|uniref:winged helix-turn-helix domain-containing protein n=1 Tax=Bullifex porci TaxID=2606638 RepID=UPI0023EF79A9|nr:LysR family transcriptional regulator [Bullifex porci]MDD7588701.1 LysR family transcriptional regulator [Bullifex porci]
MELKTKIYLLDDEGEKFMGIGVLWLLNEVAKTQSLHKAASNLSISYSKAFNMVKNLEKTIGKEVLARKKGGASREGATLTEFGKCFVTLYDEFQKKAKESTLIPYQEFKDKLCVLMEEKDHE